MSQRKILGLLAAAGAVFGVLAWLVWSENLHVLDLGSLWFPSAGYARFLFIWIVWCTLTVAPLSLAIAGWLGRRSGAGGSPISDEAGAWLSDDRTWMIGASLLAFALPNWVNLLVLGGGSLVDDEAVYQFASELLASGRLYAESPQPWIFWERIFIVNDGKWYAQYFLGWPLLMVPGVWLGVPEIMNPIYSALTAPFIFMVSRRLAGPIAARVASLLFVVSPMIVIAAATRMSHTTCLLTLTMTLHFYLIARGEGARRVWPHAAMALCFCLAFFIRPQTALPLGLPLLVGWAGGQVRERPPWATSAVFVSICLVMAGAFLAVNHAQTGDALYPAIQRVTDAQLEMGSPFAQGTGVEDGKVQNIIFDLAQGLFTVVAGVVRLNFDTFGWPVSFLFVPLALAVRSTRIVWWMAACSLLATLFVLDAGIDAFGPTHLFEISLTMILLTGVGVAKLHELAKEHAGSFGRWGGPVRWLPLSLVAALVITASAGFTPVRLSAAGRLAGASLAPHDQIREMGIENAVLFGNLPHSSCRSMPTKTWVFWPPGNDPELSNDLLWANHINIEDDRRLMASYYPDRKGYIYLWNDECELMVGAIDDPRAVSLEPNPALAPGYRVEFP